jgi:TolA-binding protein
MNEFADFVKYFPTSDNAPTAQYYIGGFTSGQAV